MADYNKLTPDLIEQLKACAPGHILTGEDVNEDYARDEMPIYGKQMPEAVLQATSAEEISAVMKFCNEHHIPVTTRGAGTGLVGGCVPVYGGVVIETIRMNKILSYDLENFSVTIEPGVLLQQLADDALTKGMMYPPDPGEKLATVGGNVSTNAGGMRAVKYGTTRDYVLAMKVVLPSGEITSYGAKVSKTSSGYSLLNLMIGSEGTLGIIVELTLKLIPAPKCTLSLVVPFENIDAAISTVPIVKMSNLDPQAIEFMEREIMDISERFVGRQVFPKQIEGTDIGACLLITFDGQKEEELYERVETISETLIEAGAMDVLVVDNPQKLRDTWAARSSFLEGIESETKLLDECDVVVPIKEIARFLKFANDTGKECGLEIKSFGHAGDGNLHIYQCSNDLEREEFVKRVDTYFEKLYKEAVACGGLVSGEHGIGRGKVKYLAESIGETNMELMRGIKRVFDPNLILNPGKVCFAFE